MIGDVSGMGVLVCSNELTKGAGNVGYKNKVVVLVVLVCDTKTSATIAERLGPLRGRRAKRGGRKYHILAKGTFSCTPRRAVADRGS